MMPVYRVNENQIALAVRVAEDDRRARGYSQKDCKTAAWAALDKLNVKPCSECYCEICEESTGDDHKHGPLGIDWFGACDTCGENGWTIEEE